MSVYKTLFFKNKRIWILSLILSLVMVVNDFYFMYISIPQAEVHEMLKHVLSTEFYIFVAMLFISFDYYTYILHGDVLEAVLAMPGGRKTVRRRMIAWMMLANAVITGFQVLLLCIYYGVIGFHDVAYIRYAMLCVLVYIFGANTIAILFSWIAASWHSYWKGCMSLLLPVFFNSSFFMESVITKVNWHYFADGVTYTPRMLAACLYVLPDGLGYADQNWYYMSATMPHVYKALFWILVLDFCILYKEAGHAMPVRKKIIGAFVGVGGMVLLGLGAFLPYSEFVPSGDIWGAWQGMETYYESEAHVQREEQAGFQIDKYDMDFTLKRKLEAIVTMELSGEENDSYKFTLDHHYILYKVTNQNGEALSFQQDGDYITVFSEEKPVSITMEYEGIHPLYYANAQGVCLPSFFCYYPKAGWQNVYRMEENLPRGYIGSFQETVSDFEVEVACRGKKLYSNLTELSHKVERKGLTVSDIYYFAGSELGVSLFGGFLECYNYDGVQVIMPRLAYFTGNANQSIDAMIIELRQSGLPENTFLVAMPWPACTTFRAGGSQIFCNGIYDMEFSLPYYLKYGTDKVPADWSPLDLQTH